MKPITAKTFEGLNLWEFESKSVRDSIHIALIDREETISQQKRGLRDAKLVELPKITDVWTDGKAKEIKALIEQAQDEDFSDPVTSLHYLGLSLDIVTSIIDDLRPKEAR